MTVKSAANALPHNIAADNANSNASFPRSDVSLLSCMAGVSVMFEVCDFTPVDPGWRR